MPIETNEWRSTRTSLLRRLKDWRDDVSWQKFFELYGHLIYRCARRTGLGDADAQDVVQEVLLSVARQLPEFKYNPALGSFKVWLLNLTRWRIADVYRKRKFRFTKPGNTASTARTDAIERLPDPASLAWDAIWEETWQNELMAAAMAQLKERLDPKKFQIFDLYVHHDWRAEKVAERFSVSVDQVYLTKHRITEALRQEVQRLEKEML